MKPKPTLARAIKRLEAEARSRLSKLESGEFGNLEIKPQAPTQEFDIEEDENIIYAILRPMFSYLLTCFAVYIPSKLYVPSSLSPAILHVSTD